MHGVEPGEDKNYDKYIFETHPAVLRTAFTRLEFFLAIF
jgi:hypothetical protein